MGLTYFGRWVTKLPIERFHLRLQIAASPATGRRQSRRGGSEESLKDGHDEEHGDENGGGDEAEGDGIDRVVEVPPVVLLSL